LEKADKLFVLFPPTAAPLPTKPPMGIFI
jgi:hypothetical protein